MNISIDKIKLITGIQLGLDATREDMYIRNTLTDNRKHMQKWDDIVTNIKEQFKEQEKFSFIPLDRGLFKPVMIFDNDEKILYTIIKKQNFQSKLSRKVIEKAHYIDAMLDYNLSYKEIPDQISFECENMFSENAEFQINTLKTDIEMFLNTENIRTYITIVIDFNGYNLKEIRAVMCSKWLEEIESEDWSEYITPIYAESYDIASVDYVQEIDTKTKVSVKPLKQKIEDMA